MRSTDARRCGIGILLALSALMLVTAVDAAAQAQAGAGEVVGTVYDATGALVPEAKVTLNSKDTGLIRETTSSSEGQYRFVVVPIGKYSVTFVHPGFKTYKADIEMTVGASLTVNAKLEIGEVTQVVEVQSTPIIEATTPAPASLIGARAIAELPITGRRFHDFVVLTPTVQIEPQRSGISFAGQRGINSNVTIDGADYNEPFFGGIRGGERANFAFTIPQEAISQFQTLAYGYSVEFGRSTGGVMNATTKSGTNEMHGSGFFFARNGALAKPDAFGRDAVTNLYQVGGSVGGPVLKGKMFYFAAFEDQKNDNPRLVIFRRLDGFTPAPAQVEAACFYRNFSGCPSGSGLEAPFTQTNDALTGFGKLDFNASRNHQFGVSYHYSKNTGEDAVSVGNQISPETSSALSNNGTEGDRTNTVVGHWTAIWSPHLVMEVRGQYSLENRPRTPNTLTAGLSNSIGSTGTTSFLPTTLDDWRTQAAGNLTWTRGTHTLKFGGEYNFLHASQFFKFNQFGIFSISTPSGLSVAGGTNLILDILSVGTGGPCPTNSSGVPLSPPCDPSHRLDANGAPANTNVTYRVNIGNGLLEANMKEVAVFIQDQWRLTPRFTVTAGFRWEGYVNPQPDVSNTILYNRVKNFPFPSGRTLDPAFIPSNYRQYMPRLGFAWDPFGKAKTVIRADAGFFYARTPLLLFAGPLNNFRTPAGDLSLQLPLQLPTGYVCTSLFAGDNCKTTYDQLRRIGIDLDTLTLSQIASLKPLTVADITNIATALGLTVDLNRGLAPIAMANNYEAPRSWQLSFGAEHEIIRGWTIGLDAIQIKTVHLQRNVDLNLPAPVVVATDLSQRPCFGVPGASSAPCSGLASQARPLPTLSSTQLRESTAKALYRAATLRTNMRRSRYLLQAYYTVGENLSDDDNERDAGGQSAANSFNLAQEYGYSRIDFRHQLSFSGLVDLPWGFTFSMGGRFRTGRPVDPRTGGDTNGDGFNVDRAFVVPGVPFPRNSFRDRAFRSVDIRLAKKFRLWNESSALRFTADLFNLFNAANISHFSDASSNANTIYGAGVSASTGAIVPPNATFLRLKNPSACSAVNPNCYDTNNAPGSPFTAQFGVRLDF